MSVVGLSHSQLERTLRDSGLVAPEVVTTMSVDYVDAFFPALVVPKLAAKWPTPANVTREFKWITPGIDWTAPQYAHRSAAMDYADHSAHLSSRSGFGAIYSESHAREASIAESFSARSNSPLTSAR